MIRAAGVVCKPIQEMVATVVPPLIKWLHDHKIEVHVDVETQGCVELNAPCIARSDGRKSGSFDRLRWRWHVAGSRPRAESAQRPDSRRKSRQPRLSDHDHARPALPHARTSARRESSHWPTNDARGADSPAR